MGHHPSLAPEPLDLVMVRLIVDLAESTVTWETGLRKCGCGVILITEMEVGRFTHRLSHIVSDIPYIFLSRA